MAWARLEGSAYREDIEDLCLDFENQEIEDLLLPRFFAPRMGTSIVVVEITFEGFPREQEDRVRGKNF